MNVDDPKLTAYALDELSGEEKAEIEKVVAKSPEAQRFVAETQGLASMLRTEYAAEPTAEVPANLIDIRDDPWFWSIARPLSIAAILALFAVIGAIAFGRYWLGNNGGRFADARSSTLSNLPAAASNGPEFAEVQAEASPLTGNESAQAKGKQETIVDFGNIVESLPRVKNRMHAIGKAVGGGRALELNKPAAAPVAAILAQSSADTGHNEALDDIRQPNGAFNTAAYDHIVENPFLDALRTRSRRSRSTSTPLPIQISGALSRTVRFRRRMRCGSRR